MLLHRTFLVCGGVCSRGGGLFTSPGYHVNLLLSEAQCRFAPLSVGEIVSDGVVSSLGASLS